MEHETNSTLENRDLTNSQQNTATTQNASESTSTSSPSHSEPSNSNQIVLTAATTEQLALISNQIHSENEIQNALELFRTTLTYAHELHTVTQDFYQTPTLTIAHHEHLTSLQSIQEELKSLPPRLLEEDKTRLVRTRINIRNSIAFMQTTIKNFETRTQSQNITQTTHTLTSATDNQKQIQDAMKTLHSELVKNRQMVRQAEADQSAASKQYYNLSETCAKLKNAQRELLQSFNKQFNISYEDFLEQHPECSTSYSAAATAPLQPLQPRAEKPDFTAITPRKSHKSISFRSHSLTSKKRAANKRSDSESNNSTDSDDDFRIRKRSRRVSRRDMSPVQICLQYNESCRI